MNASGYVSGDSTVSGPRQAGRLKQLQSGAQLPRSPAGGGIKPDTVYGATNDFGWNITASPGHVHDMPATMLHLCGIDHTRLTFRFQGRQYRLTDVHGRVVEGILG